MLTGAPSSTSIGCDRNMSRDSKHSWRMWVSGNWTYDNEPHWQQYTRQFLVNKSLTEQTTTISYCNLCNTAAICQPTRSAQSASEKSLCFTYFKFFSVISVRHLNIYQTDLHEICRTGRTLAIDEWSEIIRQWQLLRRAKANKLPCFMYAGYTIKWPFNNKLTGSKGVSGWATDRLCLASSLRHLRSACNEARRLQTIQIETDIQPCASFLVFTVSDDSSMHWSMCS